MTGIAIGFDGWGGWHFPDLPVEITLDDVGLSLADSDNSGWAGKATGQLTIGRGDQAGVIGLALSLPYQPSEFQLTYDPPADPDRIPMLAALVSFISDGWSLPGPVGDFARDIVIGSFTVTIGQVNSIEVLVTAKHPGEIWPLLPGDRSFDLSAVFLDLKTQTGKPPKPHGHIGGTLRIGQHGAIPLVVAMQASWTDFTIELDPNKDATLPTVADIADLISPDWGQALPPRLANLGSGMNLTEFSFEKASTEWSLTVAIGTKPDWTWRPIDGFKGLTFTSAQVALAKPLTGQSAGTATPSAEVLSVRVQFQLIVPKPVLTAKIDAGVLNIGALVQYVIGGSTPSWLSGIGLNEVDLTVDWGQHTYILAAQLARDIPVAGGELVDCKIEARVTPSDKSVCITARWVPPGGGSGVSGKICYPFNKFCPSGTGNCFDFPPKPNPPPSPPGGGTNPPPPSNLLPVITAILATGGLVATAVSMCSQLGASAWETAETILKYQKAAADLLDLARAISQAYDYQNALQFMQDMLKAIEAAPQPQPSLTVAAQMLHIAPFDLDDAAPALDATYHHPPAGDIVSSLYIAWQPPGPGIDARGMMHALALLAYRPTECAAPVQQRYHLLSGSDFAGLVAGAGFTPPVTAAELAQAMEEAGFGAGQAIDGLARGWPDLTLSQVVQALAGGGYLASAVGPALRASAFGPRVASPSTMASALLAGYPGLDFTTLLQALAASDFLAYQSLAAALHGHSTQPAPAVIAAARWPVIRRCSRCRSRSAAVTPRSSAT